MLCKANNWAAEFDKLSPQKRSYFLNHLPLHLDLAADEQSVQRLIQLAKDGFPRIKAEQTLDPTLSSLDYRFYFRATLRAKDPTSALWLARSRRRLSRMTDWLASGHLGGLLPILRSNSRIWEQVRHALVSLQPADRVEILCKMHRPGLVPEMYGWMRDVFDRDGPITNETTQRRFLAAVAEHERGAMKYVLSRAARVGADKELILAILANLESLCEGSGVAVQEALAEIAALTVGQAEAFIAAMDSLAVMADGTTAVTALATFESVLPEPDKSPWPLLCSAALTHALTAQGETMHAEAMAIRSMELIPPVLDDTVLSLLYMSSYVDAAGRLAMACAPFPHLWTGATAAAEQLASRGRGLSHRSQVLAWFVRVTPWILGPRDRLDWMGKTLSEISQFSSQDLDKESKDPLDLALRLQKALNRKSQRLQLTQPILDAVMETVREIDRILPEAGVVQPLLDLTAAAAGIFGRIEAEECEDYPFLQKLVSSMSCSGNMNVHVLGIESFLQLEPRVSSEEAASILTSALCGFLKGMDQKEIYGLVPELVDHIDEAWGRDQHMRTAIAHSFLTAAIQNEQKAVLEIVQYKIADWMGDLDEEAITVLTVRMAASMIAFGQRDDAQELISELDKSDFDTRATIARLLLSMGAGVDAAALITQDLKHSVDLRDTSGLEGVLETARLMLRASGDDSARALLLCAADQYRNQVGQVSDEVESTILNGFLELADHQTIELLISRAERELLVSDGGDTQMAGLWYLALALSASGEIHAAKSVWRQIFGWQEKRRLGRVYGELVGILEQNPTADGSGVIAELEEIDAILSAVGDSDKRRQILLQMCRTLRLGGFWTIERFSELILKWAGELRSGDRDSVLTALCETLADMPHTDAKRAIVSDVLDIIARREPPDSSGKRELVLLPILGLIKSETEHGDAVINKLLELLTHALAGSREAEVFEEALNLESDLGRVLSLCSQIRDEQDRSQFLMVLAKAAARNGDRVTLDAILVEVNSSLGENAGLWSVGALYRSCRSAASPDVVAAIETRIRSAPVPQDASSILRWTSNLAGTPLENLFDAALTQLVNNVDLFAKTPRDLDAMPEFLRLEPRPCLPPQSSRFKRMIEWAAHMPLVTNEDWRSRAFSLILDASVSLPLRDREEIQRLALRAAIQALGDEQFQFKKFGESMARLPWTESNAEWALSEWLNAKATSDGSRVDRCIEIIVTGFEYWAADSDRRVIDGFVRHLETMAVRPSHFNRTAAARVAVECHHVALEAYLTDLLLREYETKGLVGLGEWDLAFLARMPVAWWVDRSVRIETKAQRRELVEWVEGMAHRSTEKSWWALILASEWLSQSDPDGMESFWFDLYTLVPELPSETRALLGRALRQVDSGTNTVQTHQ
jgi:hypothetical protein